MNQTHDTPTPHLPHSGWTLPRQVQFLRCLSEKGDVRFACARVGLSRQSAYKLRRRNAEFAYLWNFALEVAREARIARLLAALPGVTRRAASAPPGATRKVSPHPLPSPAGKASVAN
jgi:hypothetical protein